MKDKNTEDFAPIYHMEQTEITPVAAQSAKNDILATYLSPMVEYGIYLYIFLLFFDKGEGLRNIGLYGALIGWITLAFSTKKYKISFDIIAYSLITFAASCVLSSVFSIEPAYSLVALKKDILEGAILFLVISTYFNNGMMQRIGKIICFAGIILLVLGLHGLVSNRTNFYTSENLFLSADKNKFGFFIGFIVPFFFLSIAESKTAKGKGMWGLSSIWGIIASILSASRATMGNVFAVTVIWGALFLKKKYLKAAAIFLLIFTLSIIFSFKSWPEPIKNHILSTPKHLSAFNGRVFLFWKPALESVKKRPFLGWGYGKKIYRDQRPFENGEKPNWKLKGGLHSTFVNILFHQGIVGLLSYLFLLFSTMFILVRTVRDSADERRFLALALLSIMVGSFFVNSFLKVVPFRMLALIIGMTAALSKKRTSVNE